MKSTTTHLLSLLIFFAFSVTHISPLSFQLNFNESSQNVSRMIDFQGDAFFNKVIRLTKDQSIGPITGSVGRAVYRDPVPLWDRTTGQLADFTTHFTFKMQATSQEFYGDGLAFFLSPYPSAIPDQSDGGSLGLFYGGSAKTRPPSDRILAVEFDSYKNPWDPSDNHVGIDAYSIISVANVPWNSSIKDGRLANAWVSYKASLKKLSVFLTYEDKPVFTGNWSLSYRIDLRQYLPSEVAVGFSAATGQYVELHQILYWDFNSTHLHKMNTQKGRRALVIGLASSIAFLVCSMGLVWCFLCCRRIRRERNEEEDKLHDISIDDEFEKGRGPRRFRYGDLVTATKNFAIGGKLGEGGFGAVYRGFLKDQKLDVAIKRVAKGSTQGRKEYISEVKVISRLRHRNLVQLVGWCHDHGDFLLVYEFMPNRSLDSHLYNKDKVLTWPERYKITLGVASALLYLHEEWEQCVVHRDVKPSNVMLDSMFNAKLGDFGLARLVDHDRGSQTTVIAGTLGYLAPECVTTGKASKESDVYSFGILALEIACGRRPVVLKEDEGKISLVEWVWELYGRRETLDAVDARLDGEYSKTEILGLMVVGLWCAHPDYNHRPSIRQAISVLKFGAPLPTLPPKMPVAMYFAPPMDACRFSYTSSEGTLRGVQSRSVGSSTSSSSATVASSSPASVQMPKIGY